MTNIAFFLVLNIFFFFLGLPIARMLPASWPWRIPCLSCIMGVSLASFAVTLLFSFNFSMITIFYVFVAYAFMSMAYVLYYRQFFIYSFWKSEKVLILSWLICAVLLIIPNLVGELRFSIFQGNHWDHFMYWDAALVSARETFSHIVNYQPQDLAEVPTKIMAKRMMDMRPTTHLLFAFTTRFFPSQMPQLNYTFLIFFLSQTFLSLCFMIRNLFAVNKFWIVSVALAFVVGFYGQYVLDINAWSNVISTSVAISFITVSILTVLHFNKRNIVIIAFLLVSLFYIYPEMYLIYVPAFVFMILAGRFWKLISTKQMLLMALVVLISFLSGFLYYRGIIHYLIGQSLSVMSLRNSLWTYFQKYLFGQGDVGTKLKMAAEEALKGIQASTKHDAVVSVNWFAFLNNILFRSGNISFVILLAGNIFLGFMGLFFLTPVAGVPVGLALTQVILLSLFCIAILLGSGLTIWRELKRKNWYLLLLLSFLTPIICQAILFLLKQEFWGSCKAFYYISPFVFIIVCIAVFFNTNRSFPRATTKAFIFVQISFAIVRIYGATNSYGIHYASPPYPSIQTDARNAKINYDWNFDDAIKGADNCSLVRIDVADKWVKRYLIGAIYNQNTAVIFNSQVENSDKANDPNYSKQEPDCLIEERIENNVHVVYSEKLDHQFLNLR